VDRGRADASPSNALLALVPPGELRAFVAEARRRTYPRGEVIFRQDDPGTALYVLERGSVKIAVTSELGDEVVLAVLPAGSIFGELSVFDGRPRSATASAVEDVTVLLMERERFRTFVRSHPEMALHLLSVVSRRLRVIDAMIEDCAFVDVGGRLAKRLLELAEEHGERVAEGVQIRPRLTQRELAGMIAASRELVNKHLSYFRAKGWVAQRGGRLVVREPAALQRRAGALPPPAVLLDP